MSKNALKEIRESLMMSRAELARKATISPFTIARIENGMPCRLKTKRKIILSLEFKISDKNKCLPIKPIIGSFHFQVFE